jgi:hypothetical protein
LGVPDDQDDMVIRGRIQTKHPRISQMDADLAKEVGLWEPRMAANGRECCKTIVCPFIYLCDNLRNLRIMSELAIPAQFRHIT